MEYLEGTPFDLALLDYHLFNVAGTPITVQEADGPHAAIYKAMGAQLAETLMDRTQQRPAPAIVFE